MKIQNTAILSALGLALAPLTTQALDFMPSTIFLDATTQKECETKGGGWTEWYGETYCTVEGFTDVDGGDEYFDAIVYARAEGIVNGYDDNTFRPEATINRVELLKILIEASDVSADCFMDMASGLTDVSMDAWYYPYLSEAMCVGLVSGYPDGTYKPANPVLVTEAAKIIANHYGLSSSVQSDVWYASFVDSLAVKGALPTTINRLDAPLTRGQMAEIVYRLETKQEHYPSHTLESITDSTSWSGGNAASLNTETRVEAEVDVEAEIDNIFDEMFNEDDGLDLDSLLDF